MRKIFVIFVSSLFLFSYTPSWSDEDTSWKTKCYNVVDVDAFYRNYGYMKIIILERYQDLLFDIINENQKEDNKLWGDRMVAYLTPSQQGIVVMGEYNTNIQCGGVARYHIEEWMAMVRVVIETVGPDPSDKNGI